jgi:hypothetical protein
VPSFLRSDAGPELATRDPRLADAAPDLPPYDEAFDEPGDEPPYDALASEARPVSGTTRDVEPWARAAPPAAGAMGTAAGGPGPFAGDEDEADWQQPQRSSGGLSRVLGWDRRPRAGSGRPQQPRSDREPAWERPRRYEAYPTLKTRVGMGSPSRLWLYAGALVVAALVLFFVPPLFLRQGGGTGNPGASASAGASGPGASGAVGSGAVSSATPAPTRTPARRTYTVRQGDTLTSIATRFKITVDQLLAANKQIKDPNKLNIGDVLVIPSPAPSEITDSEPSPT